MEFARRLHSPGTTLDLSGIPREQNLEADELSNGIFRQFSTGATGHSGSRRSGVFSAASINGRSGRAVRGHPHEQDEETGGKGSGQVEGLGLNDRRRRWEETFGGAHSAKERAP
jgi:hypothetical protein